MPWKPNELISNKIMIIIIRKKTQLRRWMWAFMAHLSTIDKDSLTNTCIRDVSKVLFSFYFVDARNIDKQKQWMNISSWFSRYIYTLIPKKGFPVHDMNYTDVTPPPPQKKKQKKPGTIKKKALFFFLTRTATDFNLISNYHVCNTTFSR